MDKMQNATEICNKIFNTLSQNCTNIWTFFEAFEAGTISEADFSKVLKEQLQVTESDVSTLIFHFRGGPGVDFIKFCNAVQSKGNTGALSHREAQKLHLLLTKIAQIIKLKDLVLKPFFYDYKLVSKNHRTCTISHFQRVLGFLGITVAPEDFLLIVKAFSVDCYTVYHVGFVERIEEIIQQLDCERESSHCKEIKNYYPGKVIQVGLPKLSRSEIGSVKAEDIFGKPASFHPCLNETSKTMCLQEIIARIKRHVLENRVRIAEFCEQFDSLSSGYVTKSQFKRILSVIGVSKLDRLSLKDDEIEKVCFYYANQLDGSSNVAYKNFINDIDSVFTKQKLNKNPYLIDEPTNERLLELKKVGRRDWSKESPAIRYTCMNALLKVKAVIQQKKLLVFPWFRDYDRHNNGHITRSQLRQVLLKISKVLTETEVCAIERKFNDDMGFNYREFLEETADSEHSEEAKYEEYSKKIAIVNKHKPLPRCHHVSQDKIVQVLAQVKGEVVRKRLRPIEFMKQYDKNCHQCILKENFIRALWTLIPNISAADVDLICKVFKSPLRHGFIDFKRFCSSIEEVFFQPNLERAPLIVPLQHIPSDDRKCNFLNFEERLSVSKAFQNLSSYPDVVSNLSSLFKEYDRCNIGTVTANQLMKVLKNRDLLHLLTNLQLEHICKCFGFQEEFQYRKFLQVLDFAFANKEVYLI